MLIAAAAVGAVFVICTLVAILLAVGAAEPSDRRDPELLQGLYVLASIVAAIVASLILAYPGTEPNPLVRAGTVVAGGAAALLVASKNWRPRNLRFVGLMLSAILAFIVLDVGRESFREQESRAAVDELGRAAAIVATLDQEAARRAVAADRGPVRSAIIEACRAADATHSQIDEASGVAILTTTLDPGCPYVREVATEGASLTTDTLPVSMALMRLRLAEYRVAVLQRPEDVTAAEEMRRKLTESQAEAAPQAAPSLADVVAAGGNAIASQAFGDDPPVLLEAAGWILIAVVALLLWRAIESRSFRQLPGPVTIKAHATDSPHKDDSEAPKPVQEAVFRASVLRNLAEPGAIPGSSALEPITDLLEIPGVGDAWFAPVVQAIKNILRTPRGSEVSFDVVPPPEKGGPWTVLVRVSEAGSGDEIDVSNQVGKNAVEACRAAGFWAAAVVLERSTRIASWASWDKDTAEALARVDDPTKRSTPDLEYAVAHAPSSGVLLQKLAFNYALEGRTMDAISASARAVAAHPRYSIARYRLVVELNMLSVHDEPWQECPLAHRRRIIKQIDRAASAMGVTDSERAELRTLAALGPQPDPGRIIGELSDAMAKRVKKAVKLPVVASRILRKTERSVWFPSRHPKFGRRSQFSYGRWTTKSLRLTDHADGPTTERNLRELQKVTERAAKEWSWFQLSYNLACMHSRQCDTDTALTWLETSLERPGSWQLSDRWVRTDPDLEHIRNTVRYEWLRQQLDPRSGRESS